METSALNGEQCPVMGRSARRADKMYHAATPNGAAVRVVAGGIQNAAALFACPQVPSAEGRGIVGGR